MSMPEHGAPDAMQLPADTPQRLLDSRATTAELMEQLLAATQAGDLSFEPRSGTELLVFSCRGVACALPLTALREVMPEAPRAVFLPFSPPWMLGIFPLRNELVGLVDPGPVLFDDSAAETPSRHDPPMTDPAASSSSLAAIPGARSTATALVVGTEERCLAWIVDAVGEIVNAQDEAILPPDESPAVAGAVLPRYVAGIYRDASIERDYALLRAEALLEDLLAALEEGGDAHHG